MSELPVSNVINVTITNTPSGLNEKNVNSVALFTTDQPINGEKYGVYISANEAAANYGTSSVTAQMVNAALAQVPNILTGDGRLVIIPLISAVAATSGNVQTANLSANLATILAVTNGDLKVTVNGVAQNLANLNFTNDLTWADVAETLQLSLIDCVVSPLTNGVEIISNKVGTGSTVALAAYGGGGTDLSGASYFNASSETATAGANSSGETILAAMARTQGLIGYVPVMTNLNLEDAAIEAIAAGVQAQDNMFLHHCASTQDIAGVATAISSATETKTRLVLYTAGQAAANLMKAAYVGRAFSVDFTGSNTSQTMNLKSLATITPDLGISQTNYAAAEVAGIDLYVSYDGVPSVVSTGGNDFFDNPYSDLALKFSLETAGFDYLRQTNTKVPQTEQGMTGLKSAYAGVCQQFVRNGCEAPGAWNSSETFGDPVIFNNNITQNGYYIYSTPIALQAAADRDARKAPLVQIAIKRAGAIQTSNVIVLVND